jgi:hypothetical protein
MKRVDMHLDKPIEQPLDSSAHIRIERAVRFCVTHSGPLYSRVQGAYLELLPILFERFGPRSMQLLRALNLEMAQGVVFFDGYGVHFGGVHWRTLKRWLADLLKLYAWSCFLRGSDPELESWLSD